jgi:hypothetical protein
VINIQIHFNDVEHSLSDSAIRIIKLLIENGCNVNIQNNVSGYGIIVRVVDDNDDS